MKVNESALSMQELEMLCKLYIECKLSVLEETELYYVLLKTDMDSVLIRETKTIMGIEKGFVRSLRNDLAPRQLPKRYTASSFGKTKFVAYAAAAILFGVIGVTIFLSHFEEKKSPESHIYSQNIAEDKSPNSNSDVRSQIATAPSNNNVNDEPATNKCGKYSSTVNTSGSHHEKIIKSHETASKSDINDDYIIITDENEAFKILQKVDGRLTAVLEKSYNAQQHIYDINNLVENTLKKI